MTAHGNHSMLADKVAAAFVNAAREVPTLCGVLEGLLSLLAKSSDIPPARLYVCGGLVRNLAITAVRNVPLSFKDVDLVLEGVDRDEISTLLIRLRTHCGALEQVKIAGAVFPVWKLRVRGMREDLDLALARTEQSTGGGHRDFEIEARGVTVVADSRRRDFTCNALYLELEMRGGSGLTARLHDYHGGLPDIISGTIRCVGDPRERFREDPLRLLRAMRFAATLPGFDIEPDTAAAIDALVPEILADVSPERIAGELARMLAADPRRAIDGLRRFGFLREVLPELEGPGDEGYRRAQDRLESLKAMGDASIDTSLLFAAFLLDVAREDIETAMRQKLSSARVGRLFFQAPRVERRARELRLPNVKEITGLCADVMLLTHRGILESPDAVLEESLGDAAWRGRVAALHRADAVSRSVSLLDLSGFLEALPPSRLDFGRVIASAGVPGGPHLHRIKLGLRQGEIDGRIHNEREARVALDWLYVSDTHLIQEHVKKICGLSRDVGKGRVVRPVSGVIAAEVRWLLFTRPRLLLPAYRDAGVLEAVFPELAETGRTWEASTHHFVGDYLNHMLLALALLYEEVPDPSPLLVLAVVFLDIGKSRTRGKGAHGRTTYYRHGAQGALLAQGICRRLGIAEPTRSDVQFIVRNHETLIGHSGASRARKLFQQVDPALFDDLLLVHKVEQTAKMRIHDGVRVEEAQLQTWHTVVAARASWEAEDAARVLRERKRQSTLLGGSDLRSWNPAWGPGLREGRAVGEIKSLLFDLQEKGVVRTREEAVAAVSGRVILCHLADDPAAYLERLRQEGLLEAVLPEVAVLVDLAQTSAWHREDAYAHTLEVVRNLPAEAAVELKLAAVFHDVGKAVTRTVDTGTGATHFFGHEKESVRIFADVAARFGWTEEDFEVREVLWLIGNHMKLMHGMAAPIPPQRHEEPSIASPVNTTSYVQHKVVIPGLTRNPEDREIPCLLRKLFWRPGAGEAIHPERRERLLALTRADTLGADPADAEHKAARLRACDEIQGRLATLDVTIAGERREAALLERVKQVWNGDIAQLHYTATGRELGRLVREGQAYVRAVLEQGRETVSVEDVMRHLGGFIS